MQIVTRERIERRSQSPWRNRQGMLKEINLLGETSRASGYFSTRKSVPEKHPNVD